MATIASTSTSTSTSALPLLSRRLPRASGSFLRQLRNASTSSLTTGNQAPIPILKPPSPAWYTGRPALHDAVRELQDALRDSRQELYRNGYLGSVDEDVRKAVTSLSTLSGVSSSHSKPGERRWLTQQEMAKKLQVSEMGLPFYRRITSLLSELQTLHPLLVRSSAYTSSNPAVFAHLGIAPPQAEIVAELLTKLARSSGSGASSVEAVVKGTGDSEVSPRNRGKGHLDTKTGIAYGMGRKKTSSARAWVVPIYSNGINPEPARATSDADDQLSQSLGKATLGESASAPSAGSAVNEPSNSPSNERPPAPSEKTTIGSILVNALPLTTYFPLAASRTILTRPFSLTETSGRYNVFVLVRGGGTGSQAQAAAVACARALAKMQEADGRVEAKQILRKGLSECVYAVWACSMLNLSEQPNC